MAELPEWQAPDIGHRYAETRRMLIEENTDRIG
jgi:hypothetical protein